MARKGCLVFAKRCAFCGSDEIYVLPSANRHRVVCDTCESEGPPADDAKMALVFWNRRMGHAGLLCRLGYHDMRWNAGTDLPRTCFKCGAVEAGYSVEKVRKRKAPVFDIARQA